MNPYVDYVKMLQTQFKAAEELPLGGFAPCPRQEFPPCAPKVVLFSPHPDDECITGVLPLRLMRQFGIRIINVPVTFGSNVERQAARAEELKKACGFLGWDIYPREGCQSLENVSATSSLRFQPSEKSDVAGILRTVKPVAVFVPHSKDWNSRHISTHFLVMDALKEMSKEFSCAVVETEVWGAMEDPNLMVEADIEILSDLIAAFSFHIGEVRRNPYHISAPFWMRDNVRRGGELIGGQGGAVPDFTFATLYRLRKWQNGGFSQTLKQGRMMGMSDDLKELF